MNPAEAIPAPRAPIWWHNLKFWRNPLTFMETLHRDYGDIVAISPKHIFIFSADYNQQALNNAQQFHTVKVPFPTPPNSALARLFTIPGQMNGPENRHQRQIMLTTLHQKYYDRYYQGIVQVITHHLATWRVGQTRDMLPEMNQITLKTPCQAIFDLDPDGEGQQVVKLIEAWGDTLIASNTTLFPFNLKGLPYHHLLRISEQLETEYTRLIQRQRARGLPSEAPLSYLIEQYDEKHLTWAELIGQMNNLFNAGNTSRAAVLAWTLFLISQHPDFLGMVQAELRRNVAGNIPTAAELANLPLLEAAIKETMRLLPPVSWFSRTVMADTQLGDYPIANGTTIICSPFVIQRHPDIYPQPHRFWPERWLTTTPNIYAYLPFGAGPRACVGSNLALFEMKLVLAMILQQYQLTPPAQAVINSTGVMVSMPQAMPLELWPREVPFIKRSVRGNIHESVNLA